MRSLSALPPADLFDAEEFGTLPHLRRGHRAVNPRKRSLGGPAGAGGQTFVPKENKRVVRTRTGKVLQGLKQIEQERSGPRYLTWGQVSMLMRHAASLKCGHMNA
ncbi:hypothetical protein QQF64_005283 [Cirrhinus molitorella]|uniref:Uncharacterized protein n=1 Tax=Cirrhinus molitorella TaxID=172907 RepID=A0ABR3MEY0_9TELE